MNLYNGETFFFFFFLMGQLEKDGHYVTKLAHGTVFFVPMRDCHGGEVMDKL